MRNPVTEHPYTRSATTPGKARPPGGPLDGGGQLHSYARPGSDPDWPPQRLSLAGHPLAP